MTLSTVEILILFLVLMGPTKALIVYAGLTASMEPSQRRKVAIRTVVIASAVTFLFLWAGEAIIASIHVQIPALKIAGGIILLLFALGLVLGDGHDDHADTGHDIAAFPLAMPLIASPQGIVILITFAAAANQRGLSMMPLYLLLGATMVINLVVLLAGSKILKYIPAAALMVMMKIAGVLLTALAVQLILWGMGDLGLVPPMTAKGHG